jgi:hypothetical protein
MTSAGIEELVGLDPEEWDVVGIDIGGGETGIQPLEVVAVPRGLAPAGDQRTDESLYQAIARHNGGELPVTHFRIHQADAFEVLTKIMHVFEFRLRSRTVLGVDLRVMSQADVPEMFMQPPGE